MRRRYSRLKRVVVESIISNDAFGLQPSNYPRLVLQEAARPGQFANKPFDEQVDEFMEWFQAEEARILEAYQYGQAQPTEESHSWLYTFLLLAFLKGLRRGKTELARAGWQVQQYPANATASSMLQSASTRSRLSYIEKRSFLGLKNITSATDTALRRILGEALLEGVDPRTVARRITEAIDSIGRHRAMLLARTEMIAAHHSATIATYRDAGVLGVRLLAEWLTAGDGRVCPLCVERASRNNGMGPGIYTLDQVETMIPVHPDCRCVALPRDITDDQIEDEP
jgi:SPP1 gp7 family putative phage head morphogenesis protein